MPWEAPLTQILQSIEGPVARIIAVIVIVITGLSLAEAIDVVVFLKGRGADRRVETIAALEGLTADGDYHLTPLTPTRLVPTA